MIKLLLATLLLSTPVLADDPPTREDIPGESLCAVVDYELRQAVGFKIITAEEANDILLRCLVNYS